MTEQSLQFHRSGFSLVELLVVCALVVVLGTMVMPALNRSRTHTRNLVCMTQLRQVGVYTHNFHVDNDDAYPTLSYKTLLLDNGAFSTFLTPRDINESGWSYYTPGSMLCPEDDNPGVMPVRDHQGVVRGNFSSFNYNVASPMYDIRYWRLQEMVAPSDYALFWDGRTGASTQGGYLGALDFANSTATQRHPLGYNVLFADGHVEIKLDITRPTFDDLKGMAGNYTSYAAPEPSPSDTNGGGGGGGGGGNGGGNVNGNGGSNPNNGHGNNLDDVDSSNPGSGNGGPTGGFDPSMGIDDERPETWAGFDPYGAYVVAGSQMPLSQATVVFSDGTNEVFGNLTETSARLTGTGANAGKVITGIYIKSGATDPGASTNHGEFHDNPHN